MTVESLLEVPNTNNSEFGCYYDFQQYRTLLAKVIQFFVSPKKCENQILTDVMSMTNFDLIQTNSVGSVQTAPRGAIRYWTTLLLQRRFKWTCRRDYAVDDI